MRRPLRCPPRLASLPFEAGWRKRSPILRKLHSSASHVDACDEQAARAGTHTRPQKGRGHHPSRKTHHNETKFVQRFWYFSAPRFLWGGNIFLHAHSFTCNCSACSRPRPEAGETASLLHSWSSRTRSAPHNPPRGHATPERAVIRALVGTTVQT